MSINVFFLLIFGLLIGMFGYFSPNYSVSKDNSETPTIELSTFTLYEISKKGIDHILEGYNGKKFETYYEITSAKFSDNTKNLLQTISADNAFYGSEVLKLNGNVHYVREDGLEFHSQEGTYNSKDSSIATKGSFAITQNNNRVDGNSLYYNTQQDMVSANRIHAIYQMK
jgi:hypothetical protein